MDRNSYHGSTFMQVMKVDHPVNQVGIYILCIVICLPTVFAPYLSGSLLLILICFHYGYKAECAASLLLLSMLFPNIIMI